MYGSNVFGRMQLAAISVYLIFQIFPVEAIQQSGCANFFQLAPLPLCDGTSQIPGVTSGGGVSSGGAPASKTPAPASKAPGIFGKGGGQRLRFRRDTSSANFTDSNSQAVAGGNGICGNYNTDTELGVCLWSGIDETGKDPSKSGWLSGAATTNCKREVEVWRAATPEKKITAKVLDGCGLNAKAFKVGCENLFLTKKLLTALDPTANGELCDLKWSFKKPNTIF
ncbi:uncharacterized protein VP01_593g2 [Puccinia sorghi]|uniref:Uncharacterized protein n=1 Tax=Puccinia sorghi TaxID=27349 RepID=A0A0L6UHQ7_9BASI|nr:uncharacterized protein VP01_593g2 [Puccinia sorghi]